MNSQQDINLNTTFDKDRLQNELDSLIASLESNPVKLQVQPRYRLILNYL